MLKKGRYPPGVGIRNSCYLNCQCWSYVNSTGFLEGIVRRVLKPHPWSEERKRAVYWSCLPCAWVGEGRGCMSSMIRWLPYLQIEGEIRQNWRNAWLMAILLVISLKLKKKIETLKSTNSFFKEKKKEKMIIGNTPYCRLIYNKYPCVKLAFFSFIFLTTRIEADKNKQYLLICTVMMTKLNNARKKCSELSD